MLMGCQCRGRGQCACPGPWGRSLCLSPLQVTTAAAVPPTSLASSSQPPSASSVALAPLSAERATARNAALHLTVAISYSGRQDLARAVSEIAALAAAGQLPPQDVTPELIEEHLATRVLPPGWRQPDLLIRTSGEQRLSNFLCYEAAYSGGCAPGRPSSSTSDWGVRGVWAGFGAPGSCRLLCPARPWAPGSCCRAIAPLGLCALLCCTCLRAQSLG